MRILLIGEYSNVHHTLAEALRRQGHEVWLVSDGDGWKDYPRDADISRTKDGWRGSLELILKVARLLPRMRGWDVVQIINPAVLYLTPKWNRWFFNYLKRNNRRLSLGCFGDDYAVIQGMKNDRHFDYTDLWADGKALDFPQNRKRLALWLSDERRELCQTVVEGSDYLIPCLYEYWKVYNTAENQDRLHYIGLPVEDPLPPSLKGEAKVKVLVGIQKARGNAKGTDRMLPLLERLAAEHPDRIELHKVENVPFAQYRQLLEEADVLADQLYSYTPAMNALAAMAEGTVVISGGEEEYYHFIGETELRPIINLRPGEDEENYKTLCDALLNREKLEQLSKESRAFVEKYHNADLIAGQYLEIWGGITHSEERRSPSSSEPIHITAATDAAYLKYCASMLLSLTDHHHEEPLEIHLLVNSVSQEELDYLSSLIDNEIHHIHYYPVEDTRLEGLPQGKEQYISRMTYSRLFLGEILPKDIGRVIYLDCDILVEGSLRGLWGTSLEDKLLAAVEDLNSADITIYGRLGINPREHVYFNAGVLLLNLEKWRECDCQKRALEAIASGRNLEYGDQDILNLLAVGQTCCLPLRYNLQDFLLRQKKPPLMREAALENWNNELDYPVIIHFTWTSKPWSYRSFNPYGKRFWAYFDQSRWKGERPKFTLKEKLWRWAYRTGIRFNIVNRYRPV